MTSVVLVHGAWFGSWSWAKTVPYLRRAGLEVLVVELPSYGADTRPPSDVSFQDGVDSVLAAVHASTAAPLLVGHSRAGMLITAAAEAAPNEVSRLAYVAAYIPGPGETTFDIARQDELSEGLETVQLTPDGVSSTLKADADLLARVYMQDLAMPELEWAMSLLEEEPNAFGGPAVETSAPRFGTVAKSSIITRRDRAITASMQQRMAERFSIDDVHELDADHLAPISHPRATAEVLLSIAAAS